jgi:hypothetical protein
LPPLRGFWPNRHRGEVATTVNGRPCRLRLTLAALAQIEACYDDTDILTLTERFAISGMTGQDAQNILRAALAATGDARAHARHDLTVKGGAAAAIDLAHQLFEAAFCTSTHAAQPNNKDNNTGDADDTTGKNDR